MTTNTPTSATTRPEWLPESEYPFVLRSMDLDRGTITYVDEGEGPTLLFVHTGMWSFIFRDVITRLRDGFRCITLDFPGYGLSPEPTAGDLDLRDQASLLGEFATRLDLSDLTLVLHDLGGLVGTSFAADHPERIRGFVMANTFAWQPEGKALVRMLGAVSSRPVTALDWLTRLIPRVSSGRAGVGRHLTKAGKQAFLGPFLERRRVVRFHTVMRDALAADAIYAQIANAIEGALGGLPVLTIFGEKNDPFGFQERHHETFTDSEGVIVANGNHFPMMDDPGLFADTVRDWAHRKHLKS